MDWASWGDTVEALRRASRPKMFKLLLAKKSFASLSAKDPNIILPDYMLMDWIRQLRQRVPPSKFSALGPWAMKPEDGLLVEQLEALFDTDVAIRKDLGAVGQLLCNHGKLTERGTAVAMASCSQEEEFMQSIVADSIARLRQEEVGREKEEAKEEYVLSPIWQYAIIDFNRLVDSVVIIQRAWRAWRAGRPTDFEQPSQTAKRLQREEEEEAANKPKALYLDPTRGGYRHAVAWKGRNELEKENAARREQIKVHEEEKAQLLLERLKAGDKAEQMRQRNLRMAKAMKDAECMASMSHMDKARKAMEGIRLKHFKNLTQPEGPGEGDKEGDTHCGDHEGDDDDDDDGGNDDDDDGEEDDSGTGNCSRSASSSSRPSTMHSVSQRSLAKGLSASKAIRTSFKSPMHGRSSTGDMKDVQSGDHMLQHMLFKDGLDMLLSFQQCDKKQLGSLIKSEVAKINRNAPGVPSSSITAASVQGREGTAALAACDSSGSVTSSLSSDSEKQSRSLSGPKIATPRLSNPHRLSQSGRGRSPLGSPHVTIKPGDPCVMQAAEGEEEGQEEDLGLADGPGEPMECGPLDAGDASAPPNPPTNAAFPRSSNAMHSLRKSTAPRSSSEAGHSSGNEIQELPNGLKIRPALKGRSLRFIDHTSSSKSWGPQAAPCPPTSPKNGRLESPQQPVPPSSMAPSAPLVSRAANNQMRRSTVSMSNLTIAMPAEPASSSPSSPYNMSPGPLDQLKQDLFACKSYTHKSGPQQQSSLSSLGGSSRYSSSVQELDVGIDAIDGDSDFESDRPSSSTHNLSPSVVRSGTRTSRVCASQVLWNRAASEAGDGSREGWLPRIGSSIGGSSFSGAEEADFIRNSMPALSVEPIRPRARSCSGLRKIERSASSSMILNRGSKRASQVAKQMVDRISSYMRSPLTDFGCAANSAPRSGGFLMMARQSTRK